MVVSVGAPESIGWRLRFNFEVEDRSDATDAQLIRPPDQNPNPGFQSGGLIKTRQTVARRSLFFKASHYPQQSTDRTTLALSIRHRHQQHYP